MFADLALHTHLASFDLETATLYNEIRCSGFFAPRVRSGIHESYYYRFSI